MYKQFVFPLAIIFTTLFCHQPIIGMDNNNNNNNEYTITDTLLSIPDTLLYLCQSNNPYKYELAKNYLIGENTTISCCVNYFSSFLPSFTNSPKPYSVPIANERPEDFPKTQKDLKLHHNSFKYYSNLLIRQLENPHNPQTENPIPYMIKSLNAIQAAIENIKKNSASSRLEDLEPLTEYQKKTITEADWIKYDLHPTETIKIIKEWQKVMQSIIDRSVDGNDDNLILENSYCLPENDKNDKDIKEEESDFKQNPLQESTLVHKKHEIFPIKNGKSKLNKNESELQKPISRKKNTLNSLKKQARKIEKEIEGNKEVQQALLEELNQMQEIEKEILQPGEQKNSESLKKVITENKFDLKIVNEKITSHNKSYKEQTYEYNQKIGLLNSLKKNILQITKDIESPKKYFTEKMDLQKKLKAIKAISKKIKDKRQSKLLLLDKIKILIDAEQSLNDYIGYQRNNELKTQNEETLVYIKEQLRNISIDTLQKNLVSPNSLNDDTQSWLLALEYIHNNIGTNEASKNDFSIINPNEESTKSLYANTTIDKKYKNYCDNLALCNKNPAMTVKILSEKVNNAQSKPPLDISNNPNSSNSDTNIIQTPKTDALNSQPDQSVVPIDEDIEELENTINLMSDYCKNPRLIKELQIRIQNLLTNPLYQMKAEELNKSLQKKSQFIKDNLKNKLRKIFENCSNITANLYEEYKEEIKSTFCNKEDQQEKNDLLNEIELKITNKIRELKLDINRLAAKDTFPTIPELNNINNRITHYSAFNHLEKITKDLLDNFLEAKKRLFSSANDILRNSENSVIWHNALQFVHSTINDDQLKKELADEIESFKTIEPNLKLKNTSTTTNKLIFDLARINPNFIIITKKMEEERNDDAHALIKMMEKHQLPFDKRENLFKTINNLTEEQCKNEEYINEIKEQITRLWSNESDKKDADKMHKILNEKIEPYTKSSPQFTPSPKDDLDSIEKEIEELNTDINKETYEQYLKKITKLSQDKKTEDRLILKLNTSIGAKISNLILKISTIQKNDSFPTLEQLDEINQKINIYKSYPGKKSKSLEKIFIQAKKTLLSNAINLLSNDFIEHQNNISHTSQALTQTELNWLNALKFVHFIIKNSDSNEEFKTECNDTFAKINPGATPHIMLKRLYLNNTIEHQQYLILCADLEKINPHFDISKKEIIKQKATLITEPSKHQATTKDKAPNFVEKEEEEPKNNNPISSNNTQTNPSPNSKKNKNTSNRNKTNNPSGREASHIIQNPNSQDSSYWSYLNPYTWLKGIANFISYIIKLFV